MKAFCLAIVFASAAVPAFANEMSAPFDKVLIEQGRASRLYSEQRISALTRRSLMTENADTTELLEPHQAVVDAARTERVRKLVKAALREVERASVGAETVRYKIRVSCKTKRRIERSRPNSGLALSSTGETQTTFVATKTEKCAVRLTIARTPRQQPEAHKPESVMRDFSITLPDLTPVAAH